jgi:elongation factor G
MKAYSGESIRNVAILGHIHTGKTQLTSALLHTAGMTPKLTKVAEGNTVTDWDEEEIAKKISISTGIAYAEWQNTKINLLDTPGDATFVNEAKASIIAADSALILVDAAAGVQVVTEKVWDYATEYDIPRAFVINWMDREHANFARALESLEQAFGRKIVPIHLPIGQEKSFRGLVDLVSMKAHVYAPGGDGKAKIEEIPAEMAEEAEKAHAKLVEMIAEGDDALMEEFFDKGTLPEEKLQEGLHQAIMTEKVFPVMVSSAFHNAGSEAILTFLAKMMPSPLHHGKTKGTSEPGDKGNEQERKTADSAPVSVFVFKTVVDLFAGRISYFKVMSGVVKNDATLQNYVRNAPERFQHLQVMQGKTAVAVAELHAGDIGAVAKLKDTFTGDTLGDKTAPIFYRTARIPEPSITFAVEPKTRADEDKIGQSIHKLMEEDLALRFSRDPQTKEFLLSGSGQKHIEVVVSKLHNRYHVDMTLKPPKVPYRETIRGKADAEGKHKKQTGGRGQFGVCRVRMEPLARGTGVEFVDDIFGGAIPRNFIPAVEKGLRDAAERGFLAGFPVTDFRAVLYDGKYHDVDSSELAFKLAGSKAFRECMKAARPSLLEPIMTIEVYAPEQFLGDIVGDLSSRRGRVSGNETRGSTVIVKGQAPLAELLSYANTLTSMTQGRASYAMEFSHYDYVPAELAQKIIDLAKKERGVPAEEEEE